MNESQSGIKAIIENGERRMWEDGILPYKDWCIFLKPLKMKKREIKNRYLQLIKKYYYFMEVRLNK